MRIHSERGAVLVMVAVALMVMIGFSAIVVDYGILWVSRSQAQAAADAGALAGASAIAGSATPTHIRDAASAYARQTPIWGEITAPADVKVAPVPMPCPASAGGGTTGCVRVDVMRGAPDASGTAHTNTLPILFGSMLGITTQGVRATATAQVSYGNSVNCIKPWAVADKWLDTTANGWDQWDLYEQPAGDIYRPPSHPQRTGFTLKDNRGMQIALKAGTVGTWSAGWTQELQFPGHEGSDEYEEAIRSCPDWIPEVGLWAGQPCVVPGDEDPLRGCVRVKTGMSQGPTGKGVADLVALDSSAYWNGSSVVSPKGVSPRIVPISIFHTSDYVNSGCGGSVCMIEVINIMGFFVEGICKDVALDPGTYCDNPNKAIVGRMVSVASQHRGTSSGPGAPTPGATFLQIPRLVR